MKKVHYLEVVVHWQQVGEVNGLVSAPLRDHHNTANLLDLWVVRRTDSVQEASNLNTEGQRDNTTNDKQIITTR